MKTITFIVVVVTACSCLSCTKKKNPEPFENDAPATKTLYYLTSAPWKETALAYENQDGTWVQKSLPASVTSETDVFKTDGSYIVYDPGGEVISTGIYDIIGDNTELALNKTITYTLSVLNSTTMQLTLSGQISYTDPFTGVTSMYFGMKQTFIH